MYSTASSIDVMPVTVVWLQNWSGWYILASLRYAVLTWIHSASYPSSNIFRESYRVRPMLLGSNALLLCPRGEGIFSLGCERCLGGDTFDLWEPVRFRLGFLLLLKFAFRLGLSGTGFVGSRWWSKRFFQNVASNASKYQWDNAAVRSRCISCTSCNTHFKLSNIASMLHFCGLPTLRLFDTYDIGNWHGGDDTWSLTILPRNCISCGCQSWSGHLWCC